MATTQPSRSALQEVLERFARGGEDPVDLLVALFDAIRPARPGDAAAGEAEFTALTALLEERADYRDPVRTAVLTLLAERAPTRFFTDTGILPGSGFFTELWRRAVHRFLPEVPDRGQLSDCLALVFHERRDAQWFGALSVEAREAFWTSLDIRLDRDRALLGRSLAALLEAVRILGFRIAAMGFEQEVRRVLPDIDVHASPFAGLGVEIQRFVEAYERSLESAGGDVEDERQVLVLVDQCREAIRAGHKAAQTRGTSLALTYLGERLSQHLDRLELLVGILASRFRPAGNETLLPVWLQFVRDAIVGVIQRDSIRVQFRSLVHLLALRVTENAGRTGEHYITRDRREYAEMWRSAAGAGLIIPVMALLKVLAGKLALAPLNQAFVYSMNYGLGFMLIHMLHFTIATKQPAMTAATLAGSISQVRGHLRELDQVVSLVAQAVRSQIAAILGNVLVAFPVALLLGLWLSRGAAQPVVSPEKALFLLAELDPLRSLALFHAAIAGVYLFLSGLVSGYVDNRTVYQRIPQRVAALRWLGRLLGPDRTERFSGWLGRNLGGLTGNLFFGVCLGTTGTVGMLVGLPLDIRHIAFSAANLGYALAALDFGVAPQTLLRCVAGVFAIGFVNLTVSFTLALWVALRSRGVEVPYARELLGRLLRRLVTTPGEFLLPPRPASP